MPKTILITGAAKRIGRALALHFAANGWHIAAHYGSAQAEAKTLYQDITSQGGAITLFQADFKILGAAETLFTDVTQRLGMPDVLINNAAMFERNDGGITQESLHAHMAVNASTPIMLAQRMRKVETAPRFIFNILDRVLDWSWPHLPAYVLSKLALEEWTKRNASAFQPELFLYGLRLGPTLRNPRESEAHFQHAITTQTATRLESILEVIDATLLQPHKQKTLIDI